MSQDAYPDPPTIATGAPVQPPLAVVVDRPAEEAEAAAAALVQDGDGSPPSAVRLFLQSGSGRAGLAMFGVMVAVSIWVLLTYPRDFGPSLWSNPSYWANNPRNAPPAWSVLFSGHSGAPHTTIELVAPSETRTIPAGEVRRYDAPYAFTADEAPTSLLLTLTGITFEGRAPSILVSLVRPDGGSVRLANVPVPGPRPGETGPYRRYYDVPARVSLADQPGAADALADFFRKQYPGLVIPRNLLTVLPSALFGVPAADGSGRTEPLHGDYRVEVQVVVASARDAIAPMDVVFGGTVFGRMGTDRLGRDLWQGLLYGLPAALLIAALTSFFSTLIGASLGVLSGYAGGPTDAVVQRVADIVSNMPLLPLLIFIVSILGRHLWLIMAVLVIFSWPGLTILVRSMVLQLREGQLIEAARSMGASPGRTMWRHVFPQVAPFVIAQMIFFAPAAILAEASLSFLGLGDPSIPTWGQMLEAGFRTGALYVGYWWWVIPPGLLVVITALAFTLLALALEPIFDPRLRRPT